MFRVRIVSVDHYMNSPIPELDISYSEFRASSVKQVPVIRLFGTTPTGEKACVHVHGVFPYICIPYDGSEPYLKLSYQLAASLDKAINIASGYSTSNTQHVFKVVLVSGIPLYGFHRKRHQFLKIYFYKPSVVKQAVNLLQNGAILNKIFQPHEAHVPYILQFFIDFNLYGMSYVDFHHVKYRRTDHTDLVSDIPQDLILPESVPPVSLSQIEVDVSASFILNRPSSQGNGQISNPGLMAIWEDENRRRLTTDDTPLEIPQLHSQRPSCNPTSSEVFYLRRLMEILERTSQSDDDTSLSGEPRPRLNVSYAIEEPPNTAALDASFVSLHLAEPSNTSNRENSDPYLEDTIVDEEIAQDLNQSISHRLSDTLERSLALDYEDLELLDALETLADTRPTAIDDDSILGSQTSRSKPVRCPLEEPLGDQDTSDDEDEKWHDKTLIAEEDDHMKLFDLTMPDIDENSIINSHLNKNDSVEPVPGPSRMSFDEFQIPQVDGVSDIPCKQKQVRNEKFTIPQVDGVNDISRPGRKSLGMRGGVSRGSIVNPSKTNVPLQDASSSAPSHRYSSRTGELIFKTNRKLAPETSLIDPSTSKSELLNMNTASAATVHQVATSSQSCISAPSLPNIDDLFVDGCRPAPTNQSGIICVVDDRSVAEIETETSNLDTITEYDTQSTMQNTMHPDFEYLSSTQSTIQNTVIEVFHDTQPSLQNTFIDHEALNPNLLDDVEPCSSHFSQDAMENIMLPYYTDDIPSQDVEVVRKLQPPVACCSSAAVGCSEGCGEDFDREHDCVDAYLDMIAKKTEGPILRGDPSLYPDQASEKEDLTEFIASEVCKFNSVGQVACPHDQIPDSVGSEGAPANLSADGPIRRSTRLASRDTSSQVRSSPRVESEGVNDQPDLISPEIIENLCDPTANISPCSCTDIDATGIPGLTTTMFGDIRDSLGSWCSPSHEVASDSEMCRLEGALQNGHMEEILRSDTEEQAPLPSTSRRDELLQFLETQKTKKDCQGTCSKAKRKSLPPAINATPVDHISDEMLHRGRKPVAGRPRLGKDMDLMRLYCSTPFPKTKKGSKVSKVSKSSRHSKRAERRLKLSISAQKKKKEDLSLGECSNTRNVYQLRHSFKENVSKKNFSSLPECSVVLERLTKKNIYNLCKKFKVKILDKSFLGIKTRHSRIFSNTSEINESAVKNCDATLSETSNQAVLINWKRDSSPLEASKSVLSSERSCNSHFKQPASPNSSLNSTELSPKTDLNQHDVNEEAALPLPSHMQECKPLIASTTESISEGPSYSDKQHSVPLTVSPVLEETLSHPTCSNVNAIEGNLTNEASVKERAKKVPFSEELTESRSDFIGKKLYKTSIKNAKHVKKKPSKVILESVDIHQKRDDHEGNASPKSLSIGRILSSNEDVETRVDKMHRHVENKTSKSMKSSKKDSVCSNKVVEMSQAKENSPKKSDILKITLREMAEVLSIDNNAVDEAREQIVLRNEERKKLICNEVASSNRKKSDCTSHNQRELVKKVPKKLSGAANDKVIRSILRRTSSESQNSIQLKPFKIPKKSKSCISVPIDLQPNCSRALSETMHSRPLTQEIKIVDINPNHGDIAGKSSCFTVQRRSKRISTASSHASTSSSDVDANGNNTVLKVLKSPSKDNGDVRQNPSISMTERIRGRPSECGRNAHSGVNSTGEISYAHSVTGMELKEISARDAKDSSKNETNLVISLDTSDIRLYLSDDEKVPSPTQLEINMSKYKHTMSTTVSMIPCVDGATESSSDSSSGSQNNDQDSAPLHGNLKRKISEKGIEDSFKSSRKHEDGPEKLDVLESSTRWFAKPYAPWSFWSPNTSPKSHHHCHVFSPPRPVSPDNTHGTGLASIQGCMDKAGSSIAKDPEPDPPEDTLMDLFHQSQAMGNTHEESSTYKDINIELSSEAEINRSRKSSQDKSISDIFSEKSFSFSEENSEDSLHNYSKNLTIINLNESPSNTSKNASFQLTPQILCSEERCHASFRKNIHKELIECDSDSNLSQSGERNHLTSNLSSESSEFQCGQKLKESSANIILGKAPPTLLKTLKKPPSRREIVDSLASLNIPDVVNQDPFCSKYCDVKGKMEVGGNVLDLRSNSFIHLEEFQSSLNGLKGLRQQQKSLFEHIWGLSQMEGDLNHLLANHLDRKEMIIAPVKKPPSLRKVTLWARARHIIKQNIVNPEEFDLKMEKRTLPSEFFQEESDVSCDSPDLRLAPRENIVQASTPDTSNKHSGEIVIHSPIFTPILQPKLKFVTTKRKSGNYLKKLASFSSPLPSVPEKEEEDMGVQLLEAETEMEVAASSSVQVDSGQNDSSLRRLLLDSQFCKDVASPMVRHMADASACQIKGRTSSPGFKLVLENLQSAKTNEEYQYITLLTLEVHVCTCGTLKPDPERDPIRCVFFSIWNDVPEDHRIPSKVTGLIAVNFNNSPTPLLNRCGVEGTIQYSTDEKSLLQNVIHLVRQWDPDILAGFEIEMLSWGFLVQRASVLGMNLVQELSRIPNLKEAKQQEDSEENSVPSGLKITGRIVLDVWRLFRTEVALQSYTFENLMYHILHQRVSHHSFESLSRWWENQTHLYRWITVRYYQLRVLGVLKLLDQLDIIGRTSELARLFGIQFFEVLSRGSQFRVESMMLRLAKPLNYIPVSPSIQQRARMRAPECLPLIMEPESRFYSDPVIVLDFQSLYPSMIIAYNYCFSTCLGRVEHLGKSSHFEFGCSELRTSNSVLRHLKDNITISPNGIAFVKKAVRQGILPRMLEEILEARLAVKQSMKQHKGDHTLQRVLHARQLGLKLIANVTYGYTAANFSGRMPCIEVGDSVVSKGRETLERAISLVHSNNQWRARVVYGDTDSLFVLVPGRSRQEAFRIGAEIANAVTQANPSPVKLKLEKVYQPSILQTKKRYVGFMYESPDQEEPIYEAKGIETVRRDGCPAVAKMLEKSLRLLFETCDVSSVKSYVSRQFSKIISGQANIQDLIFAREYRGKENYRPGACVPALELTKRWLRHDRRAEPRISERVPYIIVNGPPGSALIHLVRHPSELLSDPSIRYNAVYYITRAIVPPLARCLSLIGADVLSWYTELPRRSRAQLPAVSLPVLKRTISQYFTTMECACCGDLTHGGVCDTCQANPQLLITSLMSKLHCWEKTYLSISKICQSCIGRSEPIDCFSLDCPITFRRHQASQTNKQSAFVMQVLNEYGFSSELI